MKNASKFYDAGGEEGKSGDEGVAMTNMINPKGMPMRNTNLKIPSMLNPFWINHITSSLSMNCRYPHVHMRMTMSNISRFLVDLTI